MPVDPSLIGPATLGLTNGISQFQAFLPNFQEIRKADPANNPDFVRDVRMGELAAVMITLGIGATSSALTGSTVPSVVALATSLGLIMLYESALRAAPPEGKS